MSISQRIGSVMSDKPLMAVEAARITPVAAGWTAITHADPSTQLTVAASALTCVYLIAQLWLIARKLRSEKRRLEMDETEHKRRMAEAQAEDGDA